MTAPAQETRKHGTIEAGVTITNGKVRLQFSQSVTWMELTAAQAGALAASLEHFAERVRGGEVNA